MLALICKFVNFLIISYLYFLKVISSLISLIPSVINVRGFLIIFSMACFCCLSMFVLVSLFCFKNFLSVSGDIGFPTREAQKHFLFGYRLEYQGYTMRFSGYDVSLKELKQSDSVGLFSSGWFCFVFNFLNCGKISIV